MILDESLFENTLLEDSNDNQRIDNIITAISNGQTDLTTDKGYQTGELTDLEFLLSDEKIKNAFLKKLEELEKSDDAKNNETVKQGIAKAREQLKVDTKGTAQNNQENTEQTTQQATNPLSDARLKELEDILKKKFPYTYRITNALQNTVKDLKQNTYWMSAMQFYCFSIRDAGSEEVPKMQISEIYENASKCTGGISDTSLTQLVSAISNKQLKSLRVLVSPVNIKDIYKGSGMWDVGATTLVVIMGLANQEGFAEHSELYVDNDLNGNTSTETNVNGDIRPLTYEDVKVNDFKDATKIINNARKLGETRTSERETSTKRELPYEKDEFKHLANKIQNTNPRQVAQDVVDFLSNEPKKEVDKFIANYASKY